MKLTIECEQEADGRWLAEILELPGVLVYGQRREEATARVQALALRVLADQIENGKRHPQLTSILFAIPSAA
ncbi:MAG: type II toxin-antitoxin system HicB family antitoxin [Chloroflexota bacterium]|nr:type II toxin-antitoxin system HicB family antitoxin [Chloroflexota bacterium]